MKVYSWNMWCYNKTPNRAFRYIQNLDFDILCLQEVPESFLERLKTLPYEVASAVDIVRVYSKRKRTTATIYTVILSRFPILSSAPIGFPKVATPLRTRLFVRAMRSFGWTPHDYRGSLYADIDAGALGKMRIFSLHLTLSGPSNRKKELEIVESNLPNGFEAIVAGDFNIVEHSFFKIISWLLGSHISESLPSHDERSFVEDLFTTLGFYNPLRGTITHPFSRSQLDHILVPARVSVSKAGVSKKSYGSDHKPIFVELGV